MPGIDLLPRQQAGHERLLQATEDLPLLLGLAHCNPSEVLVLLVALCKAIQVANLQCQGRKLAVLLGQRVKLADLPIDRAAKGGASVG